MSENPQYWYHLPRTPWSHLCYNINHIFVAICLLIISPTILGFPGNSDDKNLPEMWETWIHFLSWELSWDPRVVPREGNSDPLQYSGLEISMDCIVHGVKKSQT